MKVVAVMEGRPIAGGGFNQATNAVLQMQRLAAGRFDFAVASSNLATIDALRALGLDAFHLPCTLLERLQSVLLAGPIATHVLRALRHVDAFERRLIAAGADIVYFVMPWVQARRPQRLQRLVHWLTVWDLAHLDHPEFAEVRAFGEFEMRERYLQQALAPAALIVADSDQLGARLCQRYGVDRARVLTMPFAPAPTLDGPDCAPRDEVLLRHGLAPGYFFYPAQFWAHKNHRRLLEALQICGERGYTEQLVFAGSDKGCRAAVAADVRAMGLDAQVRDLGFVDARDMRGLYQASLALVMPTYFGPTNLPPLEAWSLGVPVVYSQHLDEHAGDAALLADPDDAATWADAMLACHDPALRADLIDRGQRRLLALRAQRWDAEQQLLEHLRRFDLRLRLSRRQGDEGASS